MGQLRRLFTRGTIARLLKEADDSAAHEIGVSGYSLDAQVDRYFGQYESNAKNTQEDGEPSVDQMEALDWRDLIKGHLITEANEDEDDEEDPDDAASEDDALTGQNNSKLGLDSINVEAFANDVVRLIQNYDSLLEFRSTLLRRAKRFLEKTYNDEVVEAFENIMRDDHGMEAGIGPKDLINDKFKAPVADRANGGAGTGGGAMA
jgi:hypothetical protein